LDGSFLEDVEHTEHRTPNDIDVVTFYQLPLGQTQAGLMRAAPSLFGDLSGVKTQYFVDGYFVHLGMNAMRLVHRSAYWYSVWSHRRNQLWKGFVQIDLSPAEDASASAILAGLSSQGGHP
jgi:hypothetical protein